MQTQPKLIAILLLTMMTMGCACKKPVKYVWKNCTYWNEDTPSFKADQAVTCQLPTHKGSTDRQ